MIDQLSNAGTFRQFVEDELVMMKSLLALLQSEESLLIQNDAVQLESITPEKNNLLTRIIELEKSRNQFLIKNGYATDSSGIEAFLSSNTSDNQLRKSWNSLLAISTTAQESNRTNGILITRQMNRNQNMLNILQPTDQAGSIYGADGQSRTGSTSGRGIVAG